MLPQFSSDQAQVWLRGRFLEPLFQILTQKVDKTSSFDEKRHHLFDIGQVLSQ